MALGAQPGDVLRLVLGSTSVTVGLGLVVGVALSFALSRVTSSWMEQAAADPWILAGVIVVLAGTATAACLLPALRASTIDPMKALRFE